MNDHRRIVMPDLHLPFHDDRLLNVWMKRLSEEYFGAVDIMGDFIDCYTLSKFDRNPQRRSNMQKEIDLAIRTLQEINSRLHLDSAKVHYSAGNHEDRLRKVLWGKVPGLGEIRNLTIPELLNLKELRVVWHDVHEPYRVGDLWFTHGDLLRKHAGMSARAKSEEIHGSVVVGHTHRMGWSPRTSWAGIDHAYEVGYMADFRQLDYVRTTPNWQQGWMEITFEKGLHHVAFFRVEDRGSYRYVIGPDGIYDKYRRPHR